MSVTAKPSLSHLFPLIDGLKPSPGEEGLLAALVYADLFDYPLNLGELVRYQVGTRLTADEVAAMLRSSQLLGAAVAEEAGLYALRGREATFALRRQRASRSARLWPRARAYGRIASYLPFVRFVAVTGALAVNNLGARPDIDFLVVAAEGRVWICRRLLIVLVRIARLLGDDLCPNYIIAEANLRLDQRDFFTAHELAQMVPLSGQQQYEKMIAQNSWARSYLPHAGRRATRFVERSRHGIGKRLLEAALGLRLLNHWEAWELARMRKQLRPLLGTAAEVICSSSQCKGHTGLHRQSVLSRYIAALELRGLVGPLRVVEQGLQGNQQ